MTIELDYRDTYITDEAKGENWEFWLGDSVERMTEIPSNSVELSIYSPPFQSLFIFSNSIRDMGNAVDSQDFFDQYAYIIRENLRITVPGGVACVHVQQLATTKAMHGYIGLIDFRGQVIKAYQDQGWQFFGEVMVTKDPQVQAIRTKAHTLMFVTKDRDSSQIRPSLPDYLLIFKKPGERPEPVKTDVTHEEWILWARSVWEDIRETDTLNARIARENDDEKHLTPLQLSLIRRCVRLYSNKGDTVFTAFGGVGSELFVAVQEGRKALGIELKPSYWQTGVNYLTELEQDMATPDLFDLIADEVTTQ